LRAPVGEVMRHWRHTNEILEKLEAQREREREAAEEERGYG